MSAMKLTYFKSRGRAEITRLLFAQAQREFIDNRIEGEEWAKMKPSTPKGQLPVLEDGGMMICESATIARYVARETGLYGKNSKEAAICDMVMDSIGEVAYAAMDRVFKAKTEDEKAAANEKIYAALQPLEELIVKLRKGKFMLGDQASVADTSLFNVLEFCTGANPDFKSDSCVAIGEIAENVSAQPHIADYLASRPKTDH